MDERTLDLNFCILAQPKAGSTWLVHLLSSIIDKDYEFSDLEKYIPIVKNRKLKAPYRIHNPAPAPNIKNVKIIRNPFDSYVSWKNYLRLRAKPISDFNFSQYYRVSEKEHLIKYEELNDFTVTTLKRLTIFLNWNISLDEIVEVVNKCDILKLKQYENNTLEKEGKFLFYDVNAQKRNNVRFYNKGLNYNFRNELSFTEILEINKKYNSFIKLHWPELWEELNVSNS